MVRGGVGGRVLNVIIESSVMGFGFEGGGDEDCGLEGSEERLEWKCWNN